MIAGDPVAPVRIADGDFMIDAAVLGELLNVAPADIPALMRARAITSICEQGIDADQGSFRLSFFHGSRQAQVSIDASGRVLRRSVIDLGPQRPPQAPRSSADAAQMPNTRPGSR
jgi:hypothetical protein